MNFFCEIIVNFLPDDVSENILLNVILISLLYHVETSCDSTLLFSHFNIRLKISLVFQGMGWMRVWYLIHLHKSWDRVDSAEFYAQLNFSRRV